ncbi:hypothetical protein COBT_002709 [Conglomerata obtusa]
MFEKKLGLYTNINHLKQLNDMSNVAFVKQKNDFEGYNMKFRNKHTKRHTLPNNDQHENNGINNTMEDDEIRQKVFDLPIYQPNNMGYSDHFHFILNKILPKVSQLSVREIMDADTETQEEITRLYFMLLILAERVELTQNQKININDILVLKKIYNYMTPNKASIFQVWFDSITSSDYKLVNINLYLKTCYQELLNAQMVLQSNKTIIIDSHEK